MMLGSASGLGSPSNTGAPATGTGTNARAFDVNGDGLDDLVWADLVGYAGGDAVRYRLREWGAAFSSTVYVLAGPYAADAVMESGVFGPVGQSSMQRVPDFNGDGRGDLVLRRTTRVLNETTGTYQFFRTIQVLCTGAWTSSVSNPNASSSPIYGDFNGDGMSDLLYVSGSGMLAVRFSTGATLTSDYGLVTVPAQSVVVDWDSDGYDDVLYAASGVWNWIRATGEGFASPVSTALSAGTNPTVSDLNGDALSDLAQTVNGTWRYRTHAGSYPDLLQTATDGYGNTVTFNYAPLTSGNYTKNANASFPEQDYQGALYTVNTISASDGVAGSYTTTYWYYGAKLHLQGRGIEGFYALRTHDSRNGLYAYDYFHTLFPYTGAVYQRDVFQANNTTLISRTQNTWTSHTYGSGFQARSLPYTSTSMTQRYEAGGAYNGALISTATTTNSVDAVSGTVYDTTTTTTEASTANGVQAGASYVQRVHQPTAYLLNDIANWCIGRPGRIESTNSHNQYAGGAITRTTTIDWDAATCRPSEIVSEPGHAQLEVTRTLGYDGFGNLSSETIAGVGMMSRTTSTNWGSTGQFPVSVTNALSQTSTLGWDYALGVRTSATDPNGITVSWQYDPFGRPTRETRPDSTATTWVYADCSVSGCINANNRLIVTETALDSGGGSSQTSTCISIVSTGRLQAARAHCRAPTIESIANTTRSGGCIGKAHPAGGLPASRTGRRLLMTS